MGEQAASAFITTLFQLGLFVFKIAAAVLPDQDYFQEPSPAVSILKGYLIRRSFPLFMSLCSTIAV